MKKKLKICFIILFGLFLFVFSAHLLKNKNHEKTQNFSEEEKIFFKTKCFMCISTKKILRRSKFNLLKHRLLW